MFERFSRGHQFKEAEQPQVHTIRAHHLPWYVGLLEAKTQYPDVSDTDLIAVLVDTMIAADLDDTPEKQTDFFGENLSGIETVRANWTRTFTEFLGLTPKDTVLVTDFEGQICQGCITGEHCKIRDTAAQPLIDTMIVYRLTGAYNDYIPDTQPKQAERSEDGDWHITISAASFPHLLRTWYHDENRNYGMPVSTELIVTSYLEAMANSIHQA